MTNLLTLHGLTKAYPGVVANDDVSFDIGEGEIHALLGENGAGKSTLVKAIYGLVQPDSGTMTFRGQPFAPSNPNEARAAGVAMVFQHFSLFEAMSVAENIALGMDNPPKTADLSKRIIEVSGKYGLQLEPSRLVGNLSAGERQRVEIVRCLLQNPKLLIMDEPTSVLTPQEVERLFKTLRQIQSEGASILYISHKLHEIRALCERATVLRLGKVVGSCDPRVETNKSLAEMMVGAKLATPKKTEVTLGEPVLELDGLNLKSDDPFGVSLKEITFKVRAGEVLGIGGVAGNGQDELMSALSGEVRVDPQQICLNGAFIGRESPSRRREMGLLSAPEERLGHSAAPTMSLADNILMTAFDRQRLGRRGFIKRPPTTHFAQAVIEAFDVRTPNETVHAKSLSGGNLQKFVVGRELLQKPDLFVVNQPTWGVDALAAATIRQALLELASSGAAVIVISQDLDELMEISDTLAVLAGGRLSAPQNAADLTPEEIGLLMSGEVAA